VICPVPQKNPEKLFDFEILSDENFIKNASGSVYYPVEMSQVIHKILETPGRYAITGLPCFIKGLRLATQKNRKLKERIIFTIGLVCGQIKNKKYTEYIASLASNGNPRKLQHVYYRGKSPDNPVSNYYYQFTYENGLQYRIFWEDGISEAWVNRWFTPNACNYCDDVFAELADIAVMDAWLPEYSMDSRGANLVLVRSPEILALIQEGMEKEEINVSKIPIEKVIISQAGVLNLKRNQLSNRLYMALQDRQKAPEKRVHAGESIGILKKREIKLKARMQKESKEIFLDCCQSGVLDVNMFRDGMHPYIKQTKQLRLVRKLSLPIQVIKKISKEGKIK
jgi:coenzyme F420-reducing hydrogenase beta subunit